MGGHFFNIRIDSNEIDSLYQNMVMFERRYHNMKNEKIPEVDKNDIAKLYELEQKRKSRGKNETKQEDHALETNLRNKISAIENEIQMFDKRTHVLQEYTVQINRFYVRHQYFGFIWGFMEKWISLCSQYPKITQSTHIHQNRYEFYSIVELTEVDSTISLWLNDLDNYYLNEGIQPPAARIIK